MVASNNDFKISANCSTCGDRVVVVGDAGESVDVDAVVRGSGRVSWGFKRLRRVSCCATVNAGSGFSAVAATVAVSKVCSEELLFN